jgi:hypothetical protein
VDRKITAKSRESRYQETQSQFLGPQHRSMCRFAEVNKIHDAQ